MTVELYGIANCDTVRRARRWLEEHGVDYRFHDFRKEGAEPERLARWAEKAGWDRLLNRRSTSFRQIDEKVRQAIDSELALHLMAQNPTLIKRPVVERGDMVLVGFSDAEWSNALGQGG